MKELIAKLVKIQSTLKAPKSQFNNFGKYKYRNQEDILEAVKPLLAEQGVFMFISDEIAYESETRCYVKATVTVTDGDSSVAVYGFAREAVTKKGMDDSQITGATSSYARKYALNGMFGIDDTKDADATNDYGKKQGKSHNNSELLNLLASGNDLETVKYWRSLGGDEQSQQREWASIDKDSQKKLKELLSKYPAQPQR